MALTLLRSARESALSAYAPYSRFRVGAVVLADDGTTFSGVNVENAAYGSTICAEASAIAAAAAAGIRSIPTVAIGGLDAAECYPCGNCRQLMREFGVEHVLVQDGLGGVREHTLDDLLPHSFGPESLG
ncbi:MAG: cytidine deaminase [bacterium]|nr:cytidine deaminase [bacterium]